MKILPVVQSEYAHLVSKSEPLFARHRRLSCIVCSIRERILPRRHLTFRAVIRNDDDNNNYSQHVRNKKQMFARGNSNPNFG